MTTLIPRLFGDMSEWLEVDFNRRTNLIKVEDLLTEKEYKIRAELPGLNPVKDVHLTVAHGLLTIRADREEQTQAHNRTEFRYGMLQRSVRLPETADEDAAKATYSDGILQVTIPLKAAGTAVKQIPVAVGASK
jgi:HSP20 family molecular chaperone IbpA